MRWHKKFSTVFFTRRGSLISESANCWQCNAIFLQEKHQIIFFTNFQFPELYTFTQ